MKKIFYISLFLVAIACCACQKEEDPNISSIGSNYLGNYEYVDLDLSVKWATCNIGAEEPYDAGDMFAWGETDAKELYNFDTYNFPGAETLPLDCDVARLRLGSTWRMPTTAEIQELLNNCNWKCAYYPKTNVYGYKVTSKKNNKKFIFLPFTGVIEDKTLKESGKSGYYWASESYGGYPYQLAISDSGITELRNSYPFYGIAIRAVCE